jgi:hypothetical protein
MCTEYNKTAIVAAVAASDICVIAVGLGANVESEGRDREAAGLALPGQQNALVADAIAAAKAKGIPIIALLFVAGPVDPALFDEADVGCLPCSQHPKLTLTLPQVQPSRSDGMPA